MPPRSSYGSIDVKDDEEFESLVPHPTEAIDKKKKYCIVAGLAVVALAVTRLSYKEIVSGSKRRTPKHGSLRPTHELDDSLVLSKKSPVKFGFESLEREEDASPSKIWGNRTGPLPTNSWYLVRK